MSSAQSRDGKQNKSSYVGNIIDGRYRIERLIARGGMGSVFVVEQLYTQQKLAMKLLHEDMVFRKKLVSRFTREARAVSQLTNPHTVRMFDFGRHEALFFLVMEYLDGHDVQQILEAEGPMPWRRVMVVLDQVCQSLEEAHKAGIIHRDLKPENIMVIKTPESQKADDRAEGFDDHVKVLDFGLAKIRGGTDVFSVQSHRDLFGTPFYMAPEQIRNEEVDHRSDVYALGCLAFRMLTDQHAVDAPNTFDVLRKHLVAPIPSVCERMPSANIPIRVDRLIWRTLAKQPESRFADVTEMRAEIANCLSDPGGTSLEGEVWTPTAGEEVMDIDPALEDRLRAFEEAHQVNQEALDSHTQAKSAPKTPADSNSEPHNDRAISAKRRVESSGSDEQIFVEQDEYSRSLARSRRIKTILGLTLLIIISGLSAYFLTRPQTNILMEQEPNNSPSKAFVIRPEQTITGVIGEPLSRFESDHDYYRIYTGGANRFLSVNITGVPHLNIMAEVLDSSGHTILATVDRSGPDEPESINRLRIPSSEVLIRVTESKDGSAIATPGSEDPYKLTVHVKNTVPMPGEIEPNDSIPMASPATPSETYAGILDGYGDQDHYSFYLDRSDEGDQWRFSISTDEELPIRLELQRQKRDGHWQLLYADEDSDGEVASSFAEAPRGLDQDDSAKSARYVVSIKHAGFGTPRGKYRFRTTREALSIAHEMEPNFDRDHAVPLIVGQRCDGELSGSDDVDVFSVPIRDPQHKTIELVTTGETLRSANIAISDHNPLNAKDFPYESKSKDDPKAVRALRFTGIGQQVFVRITARKKIRKPMPYRFRILQIMKK